MSAINETWISVFAALALPVIALSAAAVAFLQYQLARQKRSDDLFEKRYELLLVSTELCRNPFPDDMDVYSRDLRENELMLRAELLFGRSFRESLRSIIFGNNPASGTGISDRRLRQSRENATLDLFFKAMK